jgi:hypothetical protein
VINLFAAVVQRFGQVDVRLAALALGFHLANHVLRSPPPIPTAAYGCSTSAPPTRSASP